MGRFYVLDDALSGQLSLLGDNESAPDSETMILSILGAGPVSRKTLERQTGLSHRRFRMPYELSVNPAKSTYAASAVAEAVSTS